MIIEGDEMCPALLLRFKEAYDSARNGDVIEIRTKWYAATQELSKLCEVIGCKVIELREEKGKYIIKIAVVKS